jgi:FtsP/CotA-like multicopper oxidase with cupredoxin domain
MKGLMKALVLLWLAPLLIGAASLPDELISDNGLLDVTLTVDLVTSLNGTRIAAGYNGKPVGPTLRVKPGDTLRVTLVNNLDATSMDHAPEVSRSLYYYIYNDKSDFVNVSRIYNRLDFIGNLPWDGPAPKEEPFYGYWGREYMNIHFHGMLFDPMLENSKFALEGGGDSKTYTFDVAADHPPGTNWYHNHVHGTSAYSLMSGLYGMIIVEDTGYDITEVPEIAAATEVRMILGETKLNTQGLVADYIGIVFDFGWVPLVNGESKPEYTFSVGETVLLRTVSASVEPAYYLSLSPADDASTKLPMIPVAFDGNPVTSIEEVDTVELNSGSRADIMVEFSEPGTYLLHRGAWNFGIQGNLCQEEFAAPSGVDVCISYDREEVFATIVVEATPIDPTRPYPPSEVPPLAPVLEALIGREVAASKNVSLDQALDFPIFQIPYDGPFIPPGTGFGLNGMLAHPSYIHGEVTYGTCEEWNVVANPPNLVGHTFHVHGVKFLVEEVDGVEVEAPFFRDTLPIFTSAKVKVCFDLFEGPFIVHCHMANHQDIGMGGFYKVVKPEDAAPSAAPDDEGDVAPLASTAMSFFVIILASLIV